MAEPRAAVVIPTLNAGARFRACLEAVAAQELLGGHELVVVDSGSEDGTVELARQFGRVVRIPKSQFNHGRTRNLGIAETSARAVALLVQDAVPIGREWLRPLVEAVEREGIAGAYSRQVPRPGCPPFIRARLERWSAGSDRPEEKRLSGEAELMALPMLERVRRLSFDNVSSCVRREVWERFPFPKRPFGEDVWFSRSAQLAGYGIMYEPSSVVEHSHHNSMWYEFRRVYLDHRNWREAAGGAVFNNPVEMLHASWNGIFERFEELERMRIGGVRGLYWRMYAVPYSLSQNLAQWLGSRSYKASLKLGFWSRVDDFMARGV